MRWYRYLPLLLPLLALVPLRGAFRGTPASIPGPTVVSPPDGLDTAPPSTEATAVFAQAIEALSEPRTTWIQTRIWQKAQVDDLTVEAQGAYVLAPGSRFRLELKARTGPESMEGTVLMVSDGKVVWQATRTGQDGWDGVKRLSLDEALASVREPASAEQLRRELSQAPPFRGVVPLLRTLASQMRWVRHEVRSTEVRLTGIWPPEVLAALVATGQPWPEGLPKRCKVMFDAQTLWPKRFEWWDVNGALQAEMELRDPVFNQPLPADRCAQLFAFDAGAATVTDLTPPIASSVANRAKQLRAER
jgi:outer membrane lipoprotein-sorting protein